MKLEKMRQIRQTNILKIEDPDRGMDTKSMNNHMHLYSLSQRKEENKFNNKQIDRNLKYLQECRKNMI